MPKLLKSFQNLLVAVVGLLLALLLLEVGARLLPPPFEVPETSAEVCSKTFGWRGAPNYQATTATEGYVHDLAFNSVGMHDTEHPQPKPAGTFRILMLGDSFVRAHQIKETETAHQILEDLLNRESSTKQFELISGGVDGWGTGQQLLYYRNEGRFYQPDMVLLMFYLGNDVTDNLPGRGITTLEGRNCYMPYFVLAEDQLDIEPWLHAPGVTPTIGRFSIGRKMLANILGNIYQSSRLYSQVEPLLSVQPMQVSGLDFYTGENQLFDYGLQLTLALVKQLHREVTQDGAEFMVVLISPSDLIEFSRMSPAEREELYQRLPVMRRAEEMPPPNEVVAETLARDGIRVLDLLPIFGQHMDRTSETVHFQLDKHWNVAGNRLAGDAIYNWLHERHQALLN